MAEKKFEIKLAVQNDIDTILNIVKQAFVQYCSAIGLKTIEALCETKADVEKDMQNKKIYVAYWDEVPVGSIRISINQKKAFISRFSILPEYQSLGIGSRLLAFVDQMLSTVDVETVELYSAAENLRLKEFYVHNGFHIKSVDNSRGYQRGLFEKKYEKNDQ